MAAAAAKRNNDKPSQSSYSSSSNSAENTQPAKFRPLVQEPTLNIENYRSRHSKTPNQAGVVPPGAAAAGRPSQCPPNYFRQGGFPVMNGCSIPPLPIAGYYNPGICQPPMCCPPVPRQTYCCPPPQPYYCPCPYPCMPPVNCCPPPPCPPPPCRPPDPCFRRPDPCCRPCCKVESPCCGAGATLVCVPKGCNRPSPCRGPRSLGGCGVVCSPCGGCPTKCSDLPASYNNCNFYVTELPKGIDPKMFRGLKGEMSNDEICEETDEGNGSYGVKEYPDFNNYPAGDGKVMPPPFGYPGSQREPWAGAGRGNSGAGPKNANWGNDNVPVKGKQKTNIYLHDDGEIDIKSNPRGREVKLMNVDGSSSESAMRGGTGTALRSSTGTALRSGTGTMLTPISGQAGGKYSTTSRLNTPGNAASSRGFDSKTGDDSYDDNLSRTTGGQNNGEESEEPYDNPQLTSVNGGTIFRVASKLTISGSNAGPLTADGHTMSVTSLTTVNHDRNGGTNPFGSNQSMNVVRPPQTGYETEGYDKSLLGAASTTSLRKGNVSLQNAFNNYGDDERNGRKGGDDNRNGRKGDDDNRSGRNGGNDNRNGRNGGNDNRNGRNGGNDNRNGRNGGNDNRNGRNGGNDNRNGRNGDDFDLNGRKGAMSKKVGELFPHEKKIRDEFWLPKTPVMTCVPRKERRPKFTPLCRTCIQGYSGGREFDDCGLPAPQPNSRGGGFFHGRSRGSKNGRETANSRKNSRSRSRER